MRWQYIVAEIEGDGLQLTPDEWRALVRAHEQLTSAGRTIELDGVVLSEPTIATCAILGRVTTGDYGVYCAVVCWFLAVQNDLQLLDKIAAWPSWRIERKALQFWRGVSFSRLEAATEFLTGTGEKQPTEEGDAPTGWGAIVARLVGALKVDGDTIRRMNLREIAQAQGRPRLTEETIIIRRILDAAQERKRYGKA